MLGAFSYFLDGDTAQAAVVVTSQDARIRSNLFYSPGREGGAAENNKKNKKSPLELLLSPAIPLLHALTPCNGGRCLDNEHSNNIFGCAVLESALGNIKKLPREAMQ
jgi:hypothetical protein